MILCARERGGSLISLLFFMIQYTTDIEYNLWKKMSILAFSCFPFLFVLSLSLLLVGPTHICSLFFPIFFVFPKPILVLLPLKRTCKWSKRGNLGKKLQGLALPSCSFSLIWRLTFMFLVVTVWCESAGSKEVMVSEPLPMCQWGRWTTIANIHHKKKSSSFCLHLSNGTCKYPKSS